MIESDKLPHPTTDAVRNGDATAFDQLYDRYAGRVMGFGLRLTGGDRAEAEDLTQETFLAAYAGRSGFGGKAKPLAWLLGITWRRWRDGLRRQQNAPKTEPLQEEFVPTVDQTASLATALTLEESMKQLSPLVREALLLTAVQRLTYTEAAQILGEPVGTVKWRVHEGTRQLRRLLNAAEERYEATTNASTAKNDDRRSPARIADPTRSR